MNDQGDGGGFMQRPGVAPLGSSGNHAVASTRPAIGSTSLTSQLPPKPAKPTNDVAWAYLRANEQAFLDAIAARLVNFALPAEPRLAWVPGGLSKQFGAALTGALGGDALFIRLPEIVYPADPWHSIDQHRPLTEGTPGVVVDGREPTGPLAFQFLAGEAIATDVQRAVSVSLAHMIPRLLAQRDAKGATPITVADLVASHPMDRVVARLLCDDKVLKIAPSKPATGRGGRKKGAQDAVDPKLFKDGVRFLLDYQWLGSTDPKLWNWVEAKDPRDATPEDVAATLWVDLEATAHAYVITQSGPFFRIDPRWARGLSPDPQYEIDQKQTRTDNVLDLAGSAVATDAAIAQAADEQRVDKAGKALPPDLKRLGETFDRSTRQIDRAKQLLSATKLWELVLPALHWVAKYREHLYSFPDDRLAALTPVIEGQGQILFEAVGAITEVAPMAQSAGLQGDDSPVLDVLRDYAITVGESHLIDSARAHLVRANRAKADLPLLLLEQSARDTSVAVADFVGQGHGDWGGGHELHLDINRRRIAHMRSTQAAGQQLDAGQVAFLAASVKEQAVDARAKSLYGQLHDLMNYARDSQFGFFETVSSIFDSDLRGLPNVIMTMLTDLRETVIEPHDKAKQADIKSGESEENKAILLGNITRRTERGFADFVERHDLKRRMSEAMATVAKQETRTAVIRMITQIVILIGASVVGGIAGNMIAGAVRGALIADAATASVGMLRVASAAGTIAGLTVDAGINAGMQLAVQGGSGKEALIGNLLGSAAVRMALTPLSRAAQTWGGASEELKNLDVWQKVGRSGKIIAYEGAVLTTSMITAAATEYVVHRIYHSDQPPTEKQAVDWAIQGGSMAVGMFIGRWTRDFESRLVQFAELKGQLLARAHKMRKLAADVAKTGNEQAALDLLIQRQDALREEARIIDELAKSPSTSHIKPEMLQTLRQGNQAESGAVGDAAFELVPLRLAGLAPDDASGTMWTGHRAQIESALEQSRRAGIDVDVLSHDPKSGTWRVRHQRKEITIVERQQKSAAILSGDDAALSEAAATIKPIEGYQDVVVHGTVDDFEVLANGKTISLDHRGLAKWLRKRGAGKGKIRLLSCETGKHPKGAAQHLANKLGVEVMAPNDILHVFPDGSMVIGPSDKRNTGSWETFKPKPSSRRFSSPKERPPERASDRLHRTREEGSVAIGDTAIVRPKVHEQSDLGDAKIRGQDFADRASAEVGGHLESTVKEVALHSAASDVQVEAGLRVLDKTFGDDASNEFKRAAMAIDRAPDSAEKQQDARAFKHASSEHRRLGKEMLDVVRNPALDLATRKAQLHALLGEVEQAVRGTKINAAKIDFAATRARIDALSADSFEDMITVDATGSLVQKGKPLGTLRQLMDKVQATNAAFQRHGIEEEYVIAISSPRDPAIPREVKILARKPKRVEAAEPDAKTKHTAVDPSAPNEDGIVVDIGVGTSDYARDVGGEQGQVVKTEHGENYTDPAMLRRDLTWKHTAPKVDVDSVVVLGDTLQTLPMMFENHSVKRLFINNINASYGDGSEQYLTLARGLRAVMTKGGRVEVQWTTSMETTGGKTRPRGHITGDGLKQALAATGNDAPRSYAIDENAPPVTDYDYSIEAPRKHDGKPTKEPPSNPVPEKRWIITFGD